jgi:hypothetical protein
MRAKVAKKKAAKKRSLLDRTATGSGLNRARIASLAFNNVYEYSQAIGIDRDTVDALERQFSYNEAKIRACKEKLQLGAEQLGGSNMSQVTSADAELLVSLVGVDMAGQELPTLQFPNTEQDTGGANNMADGALETHELPAVNSSAEGAEGPERRYRRSVPPDSDAQRGIPFEKFARAMEGFVRNRVTVLSLAEAKGFVSKNATDRFLNVGSGLGHSTMEVESTMMNNTSELDIGGQMDDSMYDAQPNSRAVTFRDGSALNSTMFVSSVSLARPTSGGALQARIRLENDSNVFSQGENMLPPLRLGRSTRKQRQDLGLSLGKRHFTKAGFDASFTRGTPRVLQSNKPLATRDLSEGGGAGRTEIEALRWELTVAREGVKHLDKMLDTNIAWVQSNCDMSVLGGNFSSRTKQKCRMMATERITSVFAGWLDSTLYWAVRRWQTAVRFERLTLAAKQFTKLKGIEKLTVALWKVITNQMLYRGWQPWLRYVQAHILHRMNKAAVQIQRIVRGRLGRVRVNNIKLGQVALTLQNLFRKTKAIAVVKEKRFVREQELNNTAVRAIQKLLSSLIKIRRAKEEAKRLRESRASVRIQKIHRGREGRKKFLEEWMKKNAEASTSTQAKDLEQLAATGKHDNEHKHRDHSSEHGLQRHDGHHHAEAASHDAHKRSLFQAEPAKPDEHSSARHSGHGHDTAVAHAPQRHVEHHKPHNKPSDSRPITPSAAGRHAGDGGRPITPGESTVSSPTHAAPPKGPNAKRTPPPSAHPSTSVAKVSLRRAESPHAAHTRVRRGEEEAASHHSTAAASQHPQHKSARRTTDSTHRKPGQKTPAASGPNTPGHSLPPSRPDSAKPRTPNRTRPTSPTAHANKSEQEMEEPAPSEEDMAAMLHRQSSAAKIQNLLRAKNSRPNKHASVDVSSQRSTSKPQNSKRRSSAEDGNSTRSGAQAVKSTRQAGGNSRQPNKLQSGRTSPAPAVAPEDAVTNIQKVARGKLARARSKKLLEEREKASPEPASVAEEQNRFSAVDETEDVGDALEVVRTGFMSALTQEEVAEMAQAENETSASAELPQRVPADKSPRGASASQGDPGQASTKERPHSSSKISRQAGSQASETSISVPATPKAPLMSKPSSPMLSQLISTPSSFLSSFHFPGFSNSRPPSQGRSNSRSPVPVPGAEEQPASSTSFFRNPFSGWGSRGNSRETTPVKQRPGDINLMSAHSDHAFQRQNTIPEQPEVINEFQVGIE